jgi:hypothetical protein
MRCLGSADVRTAFAKKRIVCCIKTGVNCVVDVRALTEIRRRVHQMG